MISLKDKVVLVTGASSGIGRSCAFEFAKLGAKLVLFARRIDRLKEIKKSIESQYDGDVFLIEQDIKDAVGVKTALTSIPPEFSEIDILVNAAGLASGLADFASSDLNDWELMIDTNIKGLLYVSQFIVKGMINRNRGHIVNIGSIAGHEVYPKGSVYCASKFAVDAIGKAMKIDLLGTKVRVSNIDPGMVHTEFSLVRLHGDKEAADKVYQGMTPLSPDDIADSILFCVTRPPHVNISNMIILATDQSAATMVSRK